MVRHHLLEIILWPNGDGTYTKILNSMSRLQELGIYQQHKLVIEMPRSDHQRMHMLNQTKETKSKRAKSNTGKKRTDAFKTAQRDKNTGKNNPMFGKKPWNKGLTKDTDERVNLCGIKEKETKRLKKEEKCF